MFLCIVILTCDSPILICLSADVGNAPVCRGHDGCVWGDVKKDCLSWNLTLWLQGWGGGAVHTVLTCEMTGHVDNKYQASQIFPLLCGIQCVL